MKTKSRWRARVARLSYPPFLLLPPSPRFEVTKRVRKMEALSNRPKTLYIIGMASDVVPGSSLECEMAGMDAYLSKPIAEEAMVATLVSLFATKSQPS